MNPILDLTPRRRSGFPNWTRVYWITCQRPTQRACRLQPLPKRIGGGGKERTLANPRPQRKGRKRCGNYKITDSA